MLSKIEVEDLQGHTLSLPLQPTTPGYTITDIEGLDPVKTTIVTSSFALLDGAQFQSAKRESRNLVLKIGIEPYYGQSSVGELRQALYAYFMPKMNVNLKFYIDGTLTYQIPGQIESCESSLFSKEPEVAVSIICFDPNFLDHETTTVNGNTVTGATETTIDYTGTIETGYLLTLNVNRALSSFSIYNRRPDGNIAQLDFSLTLQNLDVVKISTVSKNKYATLTRASSTESVLYAVSSTAKWGPLYPGNNYFRVQCSGAAIPYSLEYTRKFGGL